MFKVAILLIAALLEGAGEARAQIGDPSNDLTLLMGWPGFTTSPGGVAIIPIWYQEKPQFAERGNVCALEAHWTFNANRLDFLGCGAVLGGVLFECNESPPGHLVVGAVKPLPFASDDGAGNPYVFGAIVVKVRNLHISGLVAIIGEGTGTNDPHTTPRLQYTTCGPVIEDNSAEYDVTDGLIFVR